MVERAGSFRPDVALPGMAQCAACMTARTSLRFGSNAVLFNSTFG
jgi:hypothetical protein